MKYSTLILGAALLLASIVAARAEVWYCYHPGVPGTSVAIEDDYVKTCPDLVRPEDCLSVRFDGYKITNAPLVGFDLRIKTRTPRRGVSTSGPEIETATLNGRRCYPYSGEN